MKQKSGAEIVYFVYNAAMKGYKRQQGALRVESKSGSGDLGRSIPHHAAGGSNCLQVK